MKKTMLISFFTISLIQDIYSNNILAPKTNCINSSIYNSSIVEKKSAFVNNSESVSQYETNLADLFQSFVEQIKDNPHELEKLYDVHEGAFYYQLSILEQKKHDLSEKSNISGKYLIIHNTRKEYVDEIMSFGVKDSGYGLGSMIYDFNHSRTLVGFANAIWGTIEKESYNSNWAGNINPDNSIAVILTKYEDYIERNTGSIDNDLNYQGFCWYDINAAPVPALCAINLSVDIVRLREIVKVFLEKHPKTFKKITSVLENHFIQVALLYIWMDKLEKGLEEYSKRNFQQINGSDFMRWRAQNRSC